MANLTLGASYCQDKRGLEQDGGVQVYVGSRDMERAENRSLTSANFLTVVRLFLVPVFIILILQDQLAGALAVFLLAGITDLLDGLIARHFNQKSELGMVLDPLADKLLLVSSFLVLSLPSVELHPRIPLWLTLTVIGRDVILVAGAILVYLKAGRRLFPPSQWGKWTTTLQLMAVFAVLVVNVFNFDWLPMTILFYLTFALTVFSGLHYVARGRELLQLGEGKAAN